MSVLLRGLNCRQTSTFVLLTSRWSSTVRAAGAVGGTQQIPTNPKEPKPKSELHRGLPKVSDREILKLTLGYVWPKGEPALKARVLGSLSLLVAGKLLNVQVPYLFKEAVDSLSQGAAVVDPALTFTNAAGAVLLGCMCTSRVHLCPKPSSSHHSPFQSPKRWCRQDRIFPLLGGEERHLRQCDPESNSDRFEEHFLSSPQTGPVVPSFTPDRRPVKGHRQGKQVRSLSLSFPDSLTLPASPSLTIPFQ